MRYFNVKANILAFCIILIASSASSQNAKDAPLAEKGSTLISSGINASVGSSSIRTEGTKTGSDFSTSLYLAASYFILQNHALSAQLDYTRNNNKSLSYYSSDHLNRNKMLFLGYTYLHELNPNLSVFAQAMLGLGAARSKSVYNYANQSISDIKALQTGMLLSIGAYMQFMNNSLVWITPSISYKRTNTNWDNSTSIYSNLLFQATLTAALNNQDLYCKQGRSLAEVAAMSYMAGTFFTVTTLLTPHFNVGSSTQKYDGGTSNTNKLLGGGLNFGAGYYFLDLFAVIVALDIAADRQKNESNTYKYNNTKISVEALHHLPVQGVLRNLFFFASFGLGRSGSSNVDENTDINPNTSENAILTKAQPIASTSKSSFSNTAIGLGVGYNYPIADILSVFGKFQYLSSTRKNVDTDAKVNYRSPELALGLRIDLN